MKIIFTSARGNGDHAAVGNGKGMGKINQKIEDVQTLIQTGNSYVDSMINTKITLARSEKVDVKCTILSKMEGIDDLEFCSVFGNLMDNAIEAERKVTEKKEIIIFVEEKWDIFGWRFKTK